MTASKWAMGLTWLVCASTPAHGSGPPVVQLDRSQIKDEAYLRTDTCERLPERGRDDSFCDVVALGNRAGWHCTGVVVSPHLVLTARHCRAVTRMAWGHDAASPEGVRRVLHRHLPTARHLDVALIELDQPVPIAVHARRTPGDHDAPSTRLRAVGFGADDPLGLLHGGLKRAVLLDISGDWGCDASRVTGLGCNVFDEFVLGGQGAADTCDGDSGGPVFEATDTGWRLVGVVSRPVRNASSRCGAGGVYTRMDRVAPWVSNTVEQVEETRRSPAQTEEG